MKSLVSIFTVVLLLFSFCSNEANQPSSSSASAKKEKYDITDTATFAGGCFWCIEASFDQIKGVAEAVSGYAGGKEATASYDKVSAGMTNHAETVQIYYDREEIDYETLLDIFFTAHNPTQLNRQGPDVGKQYRSAIFYHNKEQLRLAKNKIEEINKSGKYEKAVVTELNPYKGFYKAEDYHQNYEERNPNDPYIISVSRPKIKKVREKFKDYLKEN